MPKVRQKRRQSTWKETYIYKKRPTYMKWVMQIKNRVVVVGKRVVTQKCKSTAKETYVYEKRPTYMEKDLDKEIENRVIVLKKRIVIKKCQKYVKRDVYIWKETYIHWKRQRQRDWESSHCHWNSNCHLKVWLKNAEFSLKRCIFMKRDVYVWKETYM